MKKIELTRDGVKICYVFVANTFWTRFKGLMGKTEQEIEDMGGLLIKPCSQIHTFFMKAAIDVVYFDKNWNIIKLDEKVAPGKCCKSVKGAKFLIEFPSGSIDKYEIKENSKMEVSK